MAQWVNRLWNNIFVNPPPLPLFNLLLRLTKVQHHYSLTNAFQQIFSGKAYCKVDF